MSGNWPVPFGKELSEKGPSHGHLVGGLLHSVKRTGGNTGTALRADSTGPPAPAVGLKVLAWRLSARAARAAVEVSRLAVEAGKQAPGLAAAQN